MTAKKKKSLLCVIDANIARAAGTSNHPTSSACRTILDNIMDICHRFLATPELFAEWKNHASYYSRGWLVSMFSRKKVVRHDPDFELDTTTITILSYEQKAALEKDIHLLNSALSKMGIIITLDNGLVKIWNKCKHELSLPREIVWINPLDNDMSNM